MDLFDIVVAKKLSGGGSGGVIHQTYEGTVANIMSQMSDYNAFKEALFNGSAFARLTATLGTDTATMTVVSDDGQVAQASFQFFSIAPSGITAMQTFIGHWNSRGTLDAFEQISNTSDLTWTRTNYALMASQVPCTLEVDVLI